MHRNVAKEHFDNHPSRLKTLDEAFYCISEVNFRDMDFTGKQVLIFSEAGYIALTLDKDRNVIDYDSGALLSPYGLGVNEFIKARSRDANLLLMIPMDVPALQAIQEADGAFDEQVRYSHLGVPKHIGLKHSVSSYSSPSGGNGRHGQDLRNQD